MANNLDPDQTRSPDLGVQFSCYAETDIYFSTYGKYPKISITLFHSILA